MDHTPGPWTPTWTRTGGCRIGPNDGHGYIAKVRMRPTKTNNTAEQSANVRLITATTDLLVAVEAYRQALDLIANGTDPQVAIARTGCTALGSTAIAKVRGN